MKIVGIQKLTLLDYPGTVACTIFTPGCNFCCPFCQNASLVLPGKQPDCISSDDILGFLRKRYGVLEGVAITGGEPLLQPDIADFLAQVKAIGYRIKLDTNGTAPNILDRLLAAGLVDCVAVDIKASPAGYPAAVGLSDVDVQRIDKTRVLLMSGEIPFEFRTTVVNGIHTDKEMLEIARWIAGDEEYYLQQYRESGEIIRPAGLSSPDEAQMKHYADIVRPFVPNVQIRGL